MEDIQSEESFDRWNCANRIAAFQSEDTTHGRTSVRYRSNQTVIQLLHDLEIKFVDLQVYSVIVGTFRGRPGKIVEMLERRSLDICFVQETRFRGKSVKMISGNAAQYKLFWIENEMGLGVRILLTKICVDKVNDISRVTDRIIVKKVLVQEMIIVIISVYTPQCGLDDR